MTRELLRRLSHVDVRRVAAVLVLVAIAVVLFAGAAHAVDAADHDGGHGCSLCFATVTKSGATLPASAFVLVVRETVGVTVHRSAAPLVIDGAVRLPEPRGPPAAA